MPCRSLPTFRKKVLPIFRLEESTLKMKAEYSSGILVRICQNTWRHNPENNIVLYHRFEILSSSFINYAFPDSNNTYPQDEGRVFLRDFSKDLSDYMAPQSRKQHCSLSTALRSSALPSLITHSQIQTTHTGYCTLNCNEARHRVYKAKTTQ
jgi:hypothetical protein